MVKKCVVKKQGQFFTCTHLPPIPRPSVDLGIKHRLMRVLRCIVGSVKLVHPVVVGDLHGIPPAHASDDAESDANDGFADQERQGVHCGSVLWGEGGEQELS